jgi:hypothetical protein
MVSSLYTMRICLCIVGSLYTMRIYLYGEFTLNNIRSNKARLNLVVKEGFIVPIY